MKLLYSFFFFCIYLAPTVLCSEIFEISSMDEILPHINDETVVVFGIDETLLTSRQMVGSDCWFARKVKGFQNQGFSFEEALAKTRPMYFRLQSVMEVLPVEMKTAAIIHSLQKRGNYVIGLTSRSPDLAIATVNQLRSIGISFNATPIEFSKIKEASHSKYFEGILFSTALHMDQLLENLATDASFNLKRLLFINNKYEDVKQLDNFFKASQFEYIGFRYGHADPKIESFNPKIAEVQERYFGKILPNSVAETLINNKKSI